jgi:general secretion pathway protein M
VTAAERIEQIRSDSAAYLARLSPRERLLVLAATGGVILFMVMLITMKVSGSISDRERRVGDKTQLLAQVGKLTQGYRMVEAERGALEAKLKGPPTQLMSFVAQVGKQVGVEVNDLQQRPPATTDKIKEESVQVNLAKIDLVKLARLLDELERGSGVVRVRGVKVTTRTDDPALVDVTLLVSTFQLKG